MSLGGSRPLVGSGGQCALIAKEGSQAVKAGETAGSRSEHIVNVCKWYFMGPFNCHPHAEVRSLKEQLKEATAKLAGLEGQLQELHEANDTLVAERKVRGDRWGSWAGKGLYELVAEHR